MKKNIIALTLATLFVGNAYGVGRSKAKPIEQTTKPTSKTDAKKKQQKVFIPPHKEKLLQFFDAFRTTAREIDNNIQAAIDVAKANKAQTEQQIANYTALLHSLEIALAKNQDEFNTRDHLGPDLFPEAKANGSEWHYH